MKILHFAYVLNDRDIFIKKPPEDKYSSGGSFLKTIMN